MRKTFLKYKLSAFAGVITLILLVSCGSQVAFAAKAAPSEGRRDTVSLQFQYWKPSASLSVKNGSAGSDIDAISQLGMSNTYVPTMLLKWTGKDGREYRFGYTTIKYDGNATLSSVVNYGGTSYAVSDNVVSNFKLNYFKLDTKIPFRQNGNFAFIYGIKGYNVGATLTSNTTNISQSMGYSILLPAVGFAYQTPLGTKASLYAEVSGISGGRAGYTLDAEIGLRYQLAKNFAASVGLRELDLKYYGDNSSDAVVLWLNGLFFEVSYIF